VYDTEYFELIRLYESKKMIQYTKIEFSGDNCS